MSRFLRALLPVSVMLAVTITSGRGVVADIVDFEDLSTFAVDPVTGAELDYFNGPTDNAKVVKGPYGDVLEGTFQSGGVDFVNRYDTTFGSWNGFSYSRVNNTTEGFPNQWGAITGTGRGGSGNYGVGTGYGDPGSLPSLVIPTGASIQGMYVTNTTYTYLSMSQGDFFAGPKFGGADGTRADFLLLTAFAVDANQAITGSVDFYLADYTSDDSSKDYLVKDWTYMDLSSLSGASTIYFNITGSRVGPYGLDTPAYFAVDDIQIQRLRPVPEPASLAMSLVGITCAGVAARRRRRADAKIAS